MAVDKAALAAAPAPSGLRAFWIGHASTYVELDGLRLLLDPVFAERVSPLPVGPRRFHPPPIALADLPPIDAVLISHDHYDHLDMDAVRAPGRARRAVLRSAGHRRSSRTLGRAAGARSTNWNGGSSARSAACKSSARPRATTRAAACATAARRCGRAGRCVGPQHRFFYSGDTGYSTHFQEIGSRLGPFDIAFVKIGAYGPGASWFDIHMPPEQAVQVHRDVRAKRMFPVHWSTFNLAYHDWDEPIRRAAAEARRTGVELVTPRAGRVGERGPRVSVHAVVGGGALRAPSRRQVLTP